MAARKTVTVVFCDIVDSTPLGERIDPEVHRRVQERYFEAVRGALDRHGGTVEKFIGDAAMAVFGIPVAHDDDALRAVRAAVDLRVAISSLNEGLERDYGVTLSIRTGVNTGEVVAGDPSQGQAFATGDAVATAQRLEAASRAGEILIGEPTYRLVSNAVLVEPVEPLQLKGKSQPVTAWRLLGVVEGAAPFARRLDTPMIGRSAELELLRGELAAAVEERRCRLATVVGPAGIGKSRLGTELLRGAGERATALVGSCLAYGEGITYWPLRGIVLGAVGQLSREHIAARLAGAPDAERIAALVADAAGAGESGGGSEETIWAIRRLLEHLARERPLIVGIDELQWAEPTLLDLIEYLVGWVSDAPILLLGLSRPELLEKRPSWPVTISLGPLSASETEELAEVLGAAPDERGRITSAAEGNPLFLEQLFALEQEGRDETIPASIHAILAARLDRLDPAERAVLERAAVVGREFARDAVAALSGTEPAGATLLSLVRRDLIEPAPVSPHGEDAFRFRHVLIRDAAYLGLAKETRADLHRRHATRLEAHAGPDELIGYHLEQAYRYAEELGAPNREVAVLAARHLAEAGRRAASRGDMPATATLLGRAAALLPIGDVRRLELLPQLGRALMNSGALDEAREVFTEAEAAAIERDDRQLALRMRLELLFCKTFAEPQEALAETRSVTAEVIPELEALHDDVGLAKAWRLRSDVYLNACRWSERAAALRSALNHARRGAEPEDVASTAMALATALYYGPTVVDEAIREAEDVLSTDAENRPLEAAITAVLAGLEAMRGDEARARELWHRSRTLTEELGQRFRRAGIALFAADIELLAGQPEEAVSVLRWSTGKLGEMGIWSAMSTHAGVLADVLSLTGDYAEAERFAVLSGENAADDDVFSQAFRRMGHARAVASRGQTAEALELAREAAKLADSTDSLDMQARAALALADVSGDASFAADARNLYLAKGNVVAAERLARAAAPS